MATIAEGWAGTGGGLLLGDERRRLQEAVQLVYNGYLQGPFVLPPDQLLAQLKEQGPDLLYDLVQQLQWETLGVAGYAQDLTAERTRAIDESRRLWKYNPLAQWMIWLWTNYGFGENIVVTPEDEDAVETWDEFWKADRNQAVLAQDKVADKLSNWLLVDGDRFLAFYTSTLDGETTIRRINTKEIVEIVTDPDDSSVPLFYKRQWSNTKNQQMTWYYPDWEAFFRDDLGRAELPRDAVRADERNDNTTVVILHIAFNGKDEDSLYGWPLLGAGSPWIRSQKRHLENRLAVSAAKAMYVRKATVKGGSRPVDAVIANLRSAVSSTQSIETNPPAIAGSTLVENQAVTTTDLPMTTGASDAKTDGEMFSWMAGLSGGVFPHYMGLGDAYRLACYSDDTEVLTESGWKHWSKWIPGEKIATYRHENHSIEYLPPTALHVYDYEGLMYHIRGKAIDALVTPNHRMLAKREDKKRFQVVEAQHLWKRFDLPTGANLEHRQDIETFVLPGHTYYCGNHHSRREVAPIVMQMDDWLEFLGWWLADGCLHGGSGQVELCQNADSLYAGEIRLMLERTGMGFSERHSKNGTYITWSKTSKSLFGWLEKNCGRGAKGKHLPAFAFNLSKRQGNILLEAMWKGDGSFTPKKKKFKGVLTSISKRLLDESQVLMLHAGDWGRVKMLYDENTHAVHKQNQAVWRLNRASRKSMNLRMDKNVEMVAYSGQVWCFEAPPNKMFITRRNGFPLIAGNTATSMEAPIQRQFSRYQVFWSAQLRKAVRIVLQMDEEYGDATYQTYEAEVSTDKLVEVDLDGMSQALGRVFQTIINPQGEAIPAEVRRLMLQATLRTVLQALGVDAETVIGDEVWPEAEEVEPEREEEEPELEESIALALQNYRSGLVDADDLVAFLAPSRLEEAEGEKD